MTFTEGGNFEGGRVRKGSGGGKAAGATGIGAVLLIAAAYLFGGDQIGSLVSSFVGSGGLSTISGGGGEAEGYVEDCTAEEANTDRNCRLSATVQSLDAYWAETLPAQEGIKYTMPAVLSFEGAASTACGQANSSSGPFYCPGDETIYIDVSFYDLLQSQYGASGGALAEEYVVAHEMGHHIQDQLNLLGGSQDSGADSDSVKVELMADCLAGMWAGAAATTVDPDTGKTFLEPITKEQLTDALSAAAAVGDDHIQQASAGYINPEAFTHGTSDQRMYWFSVGYKDGTIATCNTFNADSLDPPES
ncbi:MAG: neutral zinc metallopeptidase [Propionibacteriaceae bacterium]|jgi:predicted metalloprotease|nr:neutral zinc metallopeptidase [Propionibacteriaceae bacterium]